MRIPYRVKMLFDGFRDRTSASFFEAKYREKADPWNFTSGSYELSRYDSILAALSHRRYSHAFEPGCSIGVLTEKLAGLCDAVEACDLSSTAVAQAKERCARLAHVHITVGPLNEASATRVMTAGKINLLLLSEIGYYFKLPVFERLATTLIKPMPSGATLLASHWLGTSDDHILSGDQVHEALLKHPLLQHEHGERHAQFRLDRFRRI